MVDIRWGGVSGELVRPGKRRENGKKEGVCGGGGDRFKSARQGRGRPTGGATWWVRDQRGGPGRPTDGAWPIAARDR
jgi:hypothetical protein